MMNGRYFIFSMNSVNKSLFGHWSVCVVFVLRTCTEPVSCKTHSLNSSTSTRPQEDFLLGREE